MKSQHSKYLLATALLGCASAWASDGTVNVTGNVSNTTCTTIVGNGGGTGNFTITLPTVSKSTLAAAGNTAGATAFTLGVSGCTGTSTTVTPFFEAGPNVNTNGRLSNSVVGATNVEVQIKNAGAAGTVVALNAATGSQNVTAATIASGAATSSFIAQYYATGVAGAGAYSSSFTYSMVYN